MQIMNLNIIKLNETCHTNGKSLTFKKNPLRSINHLKTVTNIFYFILNLFLTFSFFQPRLYPNSVYHGIDIILMSIFKRIYNFYMYDIKCSNYCETY